MIFRYTVIVDNGRPEDERDGPFTAYLADANGGGDEDDQTPFRVTGETPILALAALTKVIAEWPDGGADRWLATPRGQAFSDHFTMGEPYPKAREKGKA